MTTASYTALPLATLTLTARVRSVPPPAAPATDRPDSRPGIRDGVRDESEPGGTG